MPEFNYTARTTDGQLEKGRIRVKDEKTLSKYLKGKNLMLTSATPVRKVGKFSLKGILNSMSKIPVVQKIFFTQNLSIMVKTGFPLAHAMKTLANQTTNKRFKEIITNIQHDVESGISFSNALAKHPKVFSELFVNMIAAGEVSGKLDEILIYLTTQMKKDHALIAKVRSAMMYPSVVVVAMVAIGMIMMVTVIPQLTGIYAETDAELPLPTKLIIWVSDSLINYGIFALIGVVVAFFGFIRLKKTKKGKYYFHLILLKLPLISTIIKKINITRFTRTLSSLLKTDIPIVQTLQIIGKTLGNVHYQNTMNEAAEKVKKGISIVKTLEAQPKLFPPVVAQMVHIGEESGTLDTISEEIANFYEEDVDQTMQGLSTIIEPILMLVIGGAVALIALAVLMPMYGLVETI